MAAASGPNIVEDGLILYYDAGNAKSYPGSGTILTDISGTGNTISVVGGPVYNSTNGGEFEFTGNETDDAAVSSFSSVSQVTVEWWGTSDYPDTNFHAPIIRTSTGNWNDGYGFYQQGTTLNWFVNQWNLNKVQSLSTTSFDYTHWVGTYDLSNIKLYRDGSLVGTTAHTSAISQPTADLDIGHALGDYDWDGKISNIKIYNRALTAAEVLQNYNAIKRRFGI